MQALGPEGRVIVLLNQTRCYLPSNLKVKQKLARCLMWQELYRIRSNLSELVLSFQKRALLLMLLENNFIKYVVYSLV
jgi:hypothetical protein